MLVMAAQTMEVAEEVVAMRQLVVCFLGGVFVGDDGGCVYIGVADERRRF